MYLSFDIEPDAMTKNKLNPSGMANALLRPQEEMLEIQRREKKIIIGIPSDLSRAEYRVPLTPQAVELLVSYGHEIMIEKNAGMKASYTDEEFREAGAKVVEKKEEILQCDIIVRVAPFDEEETGMLRGNQVIISNMQVKSHCRATIEKLMQKKVTGVAYEYL